MSYILDALRKSDQQRKRGVPLLLAAQGAVTPPRRTPRSIYALGALVLLGAGVAIGWLRPWQHETPPAPVALQTPEITAPVAPPAATAAAAPAAEGRAPEPPAAGPAQSPRASAGEPAALAPNRERTQPRAARKAPAQTATARAVEPAADAPAAARAAAAPDTVPDAASAPHVDAQPRAPAPAAVAINELPLSIQKDLPPLSVMVHAYSDDPAKRLLGINNRLLHEGDEIVPGLKLEQITLDGMILNFRGYSFRRGVR